MSREPELGIDGEWHEAPSVTITRLVCQFLLAIGVLSVSVWLFLLHPEDAPGAALAAGVVLGAWFGIVREPTWRSRHRKE